MKLKRTEVYELNEVINKLNGTFSKWFQISIYDIRNKLSPIIESIKETIKPPDGFIEFEKKRNKLMVEYCERDANGNPVIIEHPYTKEKIYKPDQKNISILTEKITTLKEEYKKDIDFVLEHEKEINDIMESEVEVDIVPIPFKYIPDELDSDSFNVLIKVIDNKDV